MVSEQTDIDSIPESYKLEHDPQRGWGAWGGGGVGGVLKGS